MEITTEQIWKDHNKELKRFILGKVKSKEIGKDILQDVFMQIHLNLYKLNDKSKARQWAYQIARNKVNDYFRKEKERINVDGIDMPQEGGEPDRTSQFAGCLASFIKSLPQKYKEAITLVELNDLSQYQLAEKLNISYSGAKSRVQRGRELLKELFSKCCKVSTDKYGNIVSAKSTCTTCAC